MLEVMATKEICRQRRSHKIHQYYSSADDESPRVPWLHVSQNKPILGYTTHQLRFVISLTHIPWVSSSQFWRRNCVPVS
jgi:hypothetical protein